ncbi:high-affinity hexose transporter [Scheffersomyces coipomensis]|uniref:high-affinity hexose transporter n=1 Tax=Scheffersomyces coipomensis TaxID=1788519 RepID=UPI00315DF9DF
MVLCALTAAFAAVIIGYDAGFIGGTVALDSFQIEFGIDKLTAKQAANISSNVVSVFQAGAFWGAIFFYPVGELIGRKIGLVISGFFLVLGAGISLHASSAHGLGPIYAGRVLTGIGVGGCSGLAPIYISESSPTLIRGKLVGLWEISWQVGGVVGYWINYGVLQHIPSTESKQWLIPFAIQLIPSGFFFFGTFFIPESPRYLVFKNKYEKAKKNLSFLRNLPEDHPYLNHELNNTIKDIEIHKLKLGSDSFFEPFKKVFFQKKIVLRLLLSTSLFVMQNGSGINAITYYSPTVFKSFGLNGTNAGLQSTGIFGILKAFASLVWLFYIVENFGRKTALVWCSLPCSLCMWYIGAYIKIDDPAAKVAAGQTKQNGGGKAAQAMLYIWTIFYGVSWNGTPWVINSEIFSQEIRTLTQAINACANWFWAFVMGRWSGQALDAIGYKFYFIFATCMVVFPIIVYFLYPETKGVPLEAIDHLFFKVPAWRSRAYALEQYRIEYESKLAAATKAIGENGLSSFTNEKYTISEESDVGGNDEHPAKDKTADVPSIQ